MQTWIIILVMQLFNFQHVPLTSVVFDREMVINLLNILTAYKAGPCYFCGELAEAHQCCSHSDIVALRSFFFSRALNISQLLPHTMRTESTQVYQCLYTSLVLSHSSKWLTVINFSGIRNERYKPSKGNLLPSPSPYYII